MIADPLQHRPLVVELKNSDAELESRQGFPVWAVNGRVIKNLPI